MTAVVTVVHISRLSRPRLRLHSLLACGDGSGGGSGDNSSGWKSVPSSYTSACGDISSGGSGSTGGYRGCSAHDSIPYLSASACALVAAGEIVATVVA